jgi:hypothetical protein
MSAIRNFRTTTYASDHFEPETSADPHAQRRIRGQLEQIDYTAFVCNNEVIGHILPKTSLESFQRLALATSTARARWVAQALVLAEKGDPSPVQAGQLAELRNAYEELAEAYEALRRMVERGYLSYQSAVG